MSSFVITPFRIVLCFIALTFAGLLVVPKLRVDLLPQRKSSSLSVSFSLGESTPEIVEQQVTSLIEGACSQLRQLKKISSVSNYNNGYVQLEFDKSTDIQFKQFELAAIIRQLYPDLPPNCSYPVIFGGGAGADQKKPLVVYSINAPLQPFQIRRETEKVFRKAFAGIPGIKETNISGVENLQLTIHFDKARCESWHVEPAKISGSIRSYFAQTYPGSMILENGEEYFLKLPSPKASVNSIENISLRRPDGPPIRIKDIASIYVEEQYPDGYFRINGQNSVTLALYSMEGENKIALTKKIKEVIDKTSSQLPKDFEIRLAYDDTGFLEKELAENFQRVEWSALILIFFILVTYRSWRYLLNLVSGLIVGVCLTVIFTWLFHVNVHLYTIAGMAISFGIMTDNAIVMLDYYRRWRSPKVFLPLLGSNLVTIAALCLVYFLPPEERNNLVDFCIIIILALVSSLITALCFTPYLFILLNGRSSGETAVLGKSPENSEATKRSILKWWKPKLTSGYFQTIQFLAKRRGAFVLLLVLLFGLPVFMLPDRWEGEKWYNRWYNATIGSDNYQENIRPEVEKWLGGTVRLFAENVYEKSGYRNPERTKLYINATLPFGNTLDQMNLILSDFEKYLATVDGIDKYVTTIGSGQTGEIEISFKKGHDNSTLPYDLKSKLVAKTLDWGGVEWSIVGVGQAFSNKGETDMPAFQIIMKGYNYDALEMQAKRLEQKLLKHSRIQKVNIDDQPDYTQKQNQEYILNLKGNEIAVYNTNRSAILNKLSNLSRPTGAVGQVILNDQYYPVVLKEMEADSYSNYDLMNHTLRLDSNNAIKISSLGNLDLLNTASSIHKEDRQYIRIVSFEYLGTGQFANKFLKGVLHELSNEMPAGYTAEEKDWSQNWTKTNQRYMLIFILLLAIFFICSILFESLKKPFVIISMIPVSFIGVFLVFFGGDYYFDQGGYAAFVMLGGLVTNSAIFIVNDFNNLRKYKPALSYNQALMEATANRARTVFLTTLCTCCGLVPFLLKGQNEVFWFSLAIGTIGGLLFSLFAIFIGLPVLLWKRIEKKDKPDVRRSVFLKRRRTKTTA